MFLQNPWKSNPATAFQELIGSFNLTFPLSSALIMTSHGSDNAAFQEAPDSSAYRDGFKSLFPTIAAEDADGTVSPVLHNDTSESQAHA